ncbi:MAG: S-layer homology domain-containing protein [Clostridiales bacterium]|nr:S-layer homology domain-containing protein [Clostridiales bacterium]
MNKKLILVVLSLICIMSVVVIATNSNTSDINTLTTQNIEVINDTDYRVNELRNNGILIGDENGNLGLAQTLKRQEMVVLISRLMGKEDEAKNWNTNNLTFLDVEKDNWAAGYIAWAKDNNITKGYSNEWFGYNDSLTLTQTQIFLLRILGENDVDMDTAEILSYRIGIMDGVKNSENSEIIRSDVAIMLYNTLYAEKDNGETLAENLGIVASLTEEEKGLKQNMEYFNVEFLKIIDIEGWKFIYINSSESNLSKKNEDEYKAFIHSIISVIGYNNMKIIDITNELEIIAYCDAENRQVLALEVDGIYNYFNMKESF